MRHAAREMAQCGQFLALALNGVACAGLGHINANANDAAVAGASLDDLQPAPVGQLLFEVRGPGGPVPGHPLGDPVIETLSIGDDGAPFGTAAQNLFEADTRDHQVLSEAVNFAKAFVA